MRFVLFGRRAILIVIVMVIVVVVGTWRIVLRSNTKERSGVLLSFSERVGHGCIADDKIEIGQ